MATRRPNTIGSNPLKASTAKSLKTEQAGPASIVQTTDEQTTVKSSDVKPKRTRSTKRVTPEPVKHLPEQSPDASVRVRRSVKETEALFEEQLKPPKSDPVKATEKPVQAVLVSESVPTFTDRHREAMAIVKTWSQWAVVAGMTPVPLLDTLVLSGTQIKLIQLLCKHYNIPFERKVAIAVATGLVGGTATSTVAAGITRAMMRNVPIAGQIFNWTVEPALSYGSTYAIGATFVRHFEANGNLLSFKGEQMKEYAAEQFHKGKSLFLGKKNSVAA